MLIIGDFKINVPISLFLMCIRINRWCIIYWRYPSIRNCLGGFGSNGRQFISDIDHGCCHWAETMRTYGRIRISVFGTFWWQNKTIGVCCWGHVLKLKLINGNLLMWSCVFFTQKIKISFYLHTLRFKPTRSFFTRSRRKIIHLIFFFRKFFLTRR